MKMMMMNKDKISSHSLVLHLFIVVLIVNSIPKLEARARYIDFHRPNASTIFDISSYGAKGDGISDDSNALISAWEAACKVPEATLMIPSGFKFLIHPVKLRGPCMPNLNLQIDGTLLAPPKGKSWPKSCWAWINFKLVQNFMVQGTGTLDGQGFDWWKSKTTPLVKPAFDNSKLVKVENIVISSPKLSPNTDGIHIQNTQDVLIQHSQISCGDDCISIQTGSSNIVVSNTYCGPGHGISIGGLGKDNSNACVSDVLVDNIVMNDTTNGARIKTWQGGRGVVRNVTYSNIQMQDVKVPIVIDQYYCGKRKEPCKNEKDAVLLTDVKFDEIKGTYTSQPYNITCSPSVPCANVELKSIQLAEFSKWSRKAKDGSCSNSYGKTIGPVFPPSLGSCLIDQNGNEFLDSLVVAEDEKICRI